MNPRRSETKTARGRCAVRLFARWTDDPEICPLALDLILDGPSGRVVGAWPLFGAADPDGSRPRPFLLDNLGVFHFADGEPIWRTDLRERPLQVGGRFHVWWTEQEPAAYEIVKVAALGSKDERLRLARLRTDS